MAVNFGEECLFDLNHYNVFKTYFDLFMTVNKKEQSVYQGISNLKIRKLRSGSGDAHNTDTEGNYSLSSTLKYLQITHHSILMILLKI